MNSALATTQENLRFTLAQLLKTLDQVKTLELEAVTIQEVCTRHRRLAICSLLLEADVSGFFTSLSRSAQAYLSVLEKVDWGAVTNPYYLCASRALPFFDALAVADLGTARKMSGLSSASWMRDDEYEDDFLYIRFLMEFILDQRALRPAEVLERFRAAAADLEPARLKICEALHSSNRQAFEAGMAELELERQEELARQRASSATDPELLATEPYVFIEGLALVRIAEWAELPVQRQYPGISSLISGKPNGPLPEL